MKWKLKSEQVAETLSDLEDILLQNREIEDSEDFFTPQRPENFSLADVGIDKTEMSKALQRIQKAKDNDEDVLIFGDYDADGVCATAILWEGLRGFGIVARPFIPQREIHGYGLSLRSLESVLAEKKPDLIITVDNGIVAHDAFAYLKEIGVDAILSDHHLPESTLPDATAIVHTTQLCGSTVAWFLARELSREAAMNSLDLAAIATVADQMILLNANRSFVKYGVEALAKTKRIGLQLLLKKADIDLEKVTTSSINYGIAPRINAMGRLKHGMDALRLLCTKSLERATSLVAELHDTNVSRQELTADMIQDALKQADAWKDEAIIVVSSSSYHEGVIGLIAGRLSEQFYKPAIVLSVGETVAKASGRSIQGVNIIELIRQVKDDLLEAGGHPMAAGFGLLSEKIPIVTKRLQDVARETISLELLTPCKDIECLLSPHLLNLETLQVLQKFAPFGSGNREPVFGLRNVEVLSVSSIGQTGKHLKLVIATDGSEPVSCIGWNLGKKSADISAGSRIDIAGTLECNEWKNRKNLQMIVKDVEI